MSPLGFSLAAHRPARNSRMSSSRAGRWAPAARQDGRGACLNELYHAKLAALTRQQPQQASSHRPASSSRCTSHPAQGCTGTGCKGGGLGTSPVGSATWPPAPPPAAVRPGRLGRTPVCLHKEGWGGAVHAGGAWHPQHHCPQFAGVTAAQHVSQPTIDPRILSPYQSGSLR